MVRFLNRGKEERERNEDFGRGVGLALTQGRSQARAMNLSTRQQVNSLGEAYFLQEDEKVKELIIENFPELLPAFSRLNATGQILKERDRKMLELMYKIILLEYEMELPVEDYEDVQVSGALSSLNIYAFFRILDAMNGYRGKLVTEEIEKTHVQIEQPKKKGIL